VLGSGSPYTHSPYYDCWRYIQCWCSVEHAEERAGTIQITMAKRTKKRQQPAEKKRSDLLAHSPQAWGAVCAGALFADVPWLAALSLAVLLVQTLYGAIEQGRR
jgi:hypothetical protein